MGDNENNIAKIIGNNIKKICTLENISQEKLAEMIGKSAHFISLLERGESVLSVQNSYRYMSSIKYRYYPLMR